MELAFVLLCVLLGTGAILYAGMRPQPVPPESTDDNASDTAPAPGESEVPGGGAKEGRV